jgi:hypothetical protein
MPLSNKLQSRPALLEPRDGARLLRKDVTMSWEPVAAAHHYQIQLRAPDTQTPLISKNVPETRFTLPEEWLQEGRSYSLAVGAVAAWGEVLWSETPINIFISPAVALTRPTLLEPRDGARLLRKDVTMSWEPVAAAHHYQIQLRAPDTQAPLISKNVSETRFTLPEEWLHEGRSYSLAIGAVAAWGEVLWSGPSANVLISTGATVTAPVTPEPQAPAKPPEEPPIIVEPQAPTQPQGEPPIITGPPDLAPSGLTPPIFLKPEDDDRLRSSEVIISWEPVVGADSYLIELQDFEANVSRNIALPSTQTTFQVPEEWVQEGHSYFVLVAAQDSEGTLAWSLASPFFSVIPPEADSQAAWEDQAAPPA